ncbi:hypothetical protein SE91_27960 [Bradyrhizobium sp. DOA1]|nr:hypothetical protein SE91_27960 [Bradyrhizobium sp. DOA1]
MDHDWEKVALCARLDLCRELIKEFPEGLTADHLRVFEAALVADLRALGCVDCRDVSGKIKEKAN